MDITDETHTAASRAAEEVYKRWHAIPNRDAYVSSFIALAAKSAVEAAAPLIAAQALRSAAQAVRNMPYELGDTGWNALADKAEEAGYERQRVLRHYRDDRSFTHATIGAAYQYGYRSAAEVVDKLATGSP